MAATDVTRGNVRVDGNGSSIGRVARRLATETKQAFKTTEFWAMVALVVAILVSAAVINGGDNGTDEFPASHGCSVAFSAPATSSPSARQVVTTSPTRDRAPRTRHYEVSP